MLEADEYREHFLELRPEILIITSIDFDHADYFEDSETNEFQIGKGEILMMSLVSDKFRKVITSKKINIKDKLDFVISTSLDLAGKTKSLFLIFKNL